MWLNILRTKSDVEAVPLIRDPQPFSKRLLGRARLHSFGKHVVLSEPSVVKSVHLVHFRSDRVPPAAKMEAWHADKEDPSHLGANWRMYPRPNGSHIIANFDLAEVGEYCGPIYQVRAGWAGTPSQMTGYMHFLDNNNAKVIGVCTPGHFAVPPFQLKPTIEGAALDHAALVDELDMQIGQQVYVGSGHSMGGLITAFAVALRPHAFQAYMPINAVGAKVTRGRAEMGIRQASCIFWEPGTQYRLALARSALTDVRSPHFRYLVQLSDSIRETPALTAYESIADAHVPTVVFRGQKDPVVTRDMALQTAALTNAAGYFELPNKGHGMLHHMQDPLPYLLRLENAVIEEDFAIVAGGALRVGVTPRDYMVLHSSARQKWWVGQEHDLEQRFTDALAADKKHVFDLSAPFAPEMV